jgi:hypothetical protein
MAENDYNKLTTANWSQKNDNRGASKKKAIPVLAGWWNKLVVGKNKIAADEIVGATSTATALTVTNTGGTAATQMLNLVSESLTPADADKMYISFTAESDAGTAREFVRLAAESVDVTDGSEDGSFEISCMVGGTLTKVWDTQVSTSGAATTTAPIGDFVLTDGSITLTDADNAVSLSVTNDTATTSDVIQFTGSGVFTGTGASAFTAITQSGLTTGEALSITTAAQTTGNSLSITGGGANLLTGGSVARFDMGAATAGSGLEIVSSGTYTGTDGLLHIDGSSATTGRLAYINGAALTSGSALQIDANGVTALTTDGAIESSLNAGTAGTNVTAVEYSDGRNYTTELTLSAVSYTVAGAAAEAIGALIYTFPAGAHFHSVSYMSVAATGGGTVDADTPDVGVGSVIGTGAVATLDGTATFEDYITGQTATDCSGTATVAGPLGATAGIHTGISLNASTDVKAVHLNYADTWAGADTFTVTGTIVIKWTKVS